MLGAALNNLSSLLIDIGDFGRAAPVASESVELYRSEQDDEGLTVALLNLGFAQLELGDLEAARAALGESLRLSRPVKATVRIAPCLRAIANLALRSGAPAKAVTLLAAAEALYEAAELTPQPYESDLAVRTEQIARGVLDATSFAGARETGQRLDADDAIDLALAVHPE